MCNVKRTKKTTGVTLTELLVVLAIIGLLATIAVPVYINRSEQAKVRIARQECQEIAKAEDICAMTHGFYVPIQMLDDVPISNEADADSIDKEPDSIYLIDSGIPATTQVNQQPQLGDRGTNTKVANLYYYWQGPFLNPTRVWYDPTRFDSAWDPDMSTTDRRQDYPIDPWGQPYRLYSDIGIIGTGATGSNYASTSFSDGRLTTVDDRFDRFAVVSFGPDGLRDTDPGRNVAAPSDDIVYYFGTVATETAYRLW